MQETFIWIGWFSRMGHFIEEAKSLREQQQDNSSAYLRGFNKSFLALGGLFRAALQVSFITYASHDAEYCTFKE